MRKLVAVAVLLIAGFVAVGAAQVAVKPNERLSEVVGRLQGKAGEIDFPCGLYEVDDTINISVDGVWLRGSGYCSQIHVTTNKDVFNVTKAFFALEGFEVIIASAQDRTGANFIRGGGSQGRVEHVRFTGSPTLSNNGRIFYADSQAGSGWVWDDVRLSGGVTWQAFISMNSGTEKTVASTKITNSGGGVTFTDAAFDLNGAIDTFQLTQIDMPLRHGHVFWLRNTLGSPIAPRWVLCSNCSIETRGSTAIQLDASRDFSYHGYVSGADLAVFVGQGAVDTDISHIVFPSMIKGAITIAAGAVNTMIKDNFFEDTTDGGLNQYNTITVQPGASNFQITGNMWRSTNSHKARYAIDLGQGVSNYSLVDNQIPGNIGNSVPIANPVGGTNYVVTGNSGTPDKTAVK